jgi:hypothetical protein
MQMIIEPTSCQRVLPSGKQSRVFRPPRFFQSGCPSFTVNDVNSGIARVNAHCSCPRGDRGVSKTPPHWHRGPAPCLRTQNCKIKNKKPTGGGAVKVRAILNSRTGGAPTQRFFSGPANFRKVRGQIRESFQRRRRAIGAFISHGPVGGGQKSGISHAGPAGRQRIISAELRKTFSATVSRGVVKSLGSFMRDRRASAKKAARYSRGFVFLLTAVADGAPKIRREIPPGGVGGGRG